MGLNVSFQKPYRIAVVIQPWHPGPDRGAFNIPVYLKSDCE